MKQRPVKTAIYQSTALIAVVFLLLILFLSAGYFFVLPHEDLSSERREALAGIEEQRSKWQAAAPDDYEYRLTRRCFGCNDTIEVTMTNGVEHATYPDDPSPGSPAGARELPEAVSIADVFDVLDRATRSASEVTVKYHPRYGFPTELVIDWSDEIVDDEESYFIERFVALY